MTKRTEATFLPKCIVSVTVAIDHDTEEELAAKLAECKESLLAQIERAMDRGDISLGDARVYNSFEDLGEPGIEELGDIAGLD